MRRTQTRAVTKSEPMNVVVRSPQCLGGAPHRGGRPYPVIYKACIAQAMGFIGRVSMQRNDLRGPLNVTWILGGHHGRSLTTGVCEDL